MAGWPFRVLSLLHACSGSQAQVQMTFERGSAMRLPPSSRLLSS